MAWGTSFRFELFSGDMHGPETVNRPDAVDPITVRVTLRIIANLEKKKNLKIMNNLSAIKCISHSWNCYVLVSVHFLMEFSAALQDWGTTCAANLNHLCFWLIFGYIHAIILRAASSKD